MSRWRRAAASRNVVTSELIGCLAAQIPVRLLVLGIEKIYRTTAHVLRCRPPSRSLQRFYSACQVNCPKPVK